MNLLPDNEMAETSLRRTPRKCIANKKYKDESTDDEDELLPIKKAKLPDGVNDDNNVDQTDYIAIGKGTFQKRWKFPMTTVCPQFKCSATYTSRSAAMAHNITEHAESAILCEICVKPIASRNKQNFLLHLNKMHPHDPLPGWNEGETLDEPVNRRRALSRTRSSSPARPSSRTRSSSQPSPRRRPSLVSQPSSVTENHGLKILVDVKEYSDVQVGVKGNCVMIDATQIESNERADIKKNLSYQCTVKYEFEPSDVTSTLSPDRLLSVAIPKTVSGRVHQVTIRKTK